MNIIFFTDSDITPFMGGVERVTINLVKKLKERGHQCFLGFFEASNADTCRDFVGKFCLQKENLSSQLKDILIDHCINVCVINLCVKYNIRIFNQILYAVTRELGNVRVIYGYYNYPGFELFGLSVPLAFHRLTHGGINGNNINGLVTTIANKMHIDWFIRNRIANKLRLGLFSDEIVLLSEQYIQRYLNIIGNDITHNFSAIGNPLSYKKNIEIAKELFISISTVKAHVSSILYKFQARSRSEAAIKAVETVDECLGRVVKTINEKHGNLIITADHGNCEQMIDYTTGEPHTAHTTNLVPLILVSQKENIKLKDGGKLADLSPTILDLMQIEKPEEMTGESLVEKE